MSVWGGFTDDQGRGNEVLKHAVLVSVWPPSCPQAGEVREAGMIRDVKRIR